MFFHVSVERKFKNETLYRVDLDEATLMDDFVKPYYSGEPLIIKGKRITADDIKEFKVTKTSKNSNDLLPIIQDNLDSSPWGGLAALTSDERRVFSYGTDATEECSQKFTEAQKNENKPIKDNTDQHLPIFVGSTFVDLEEYRRSVREALVQLETIVRGMEYFGSKPGRPLEECLNVVRSCKVYIGIFSMRYGSIPEGHEKSMTQLEYEEGQKYQLPSLIYLIDEEKQPVLPKHVETGEGAHKLVTFKKHLKSKHMVSFFTTPADLASRILHDVPVVIKKLGSNVKEAPIKDIITTPVSPENQNTLEHDPKGYYVEKPSNRKICSLCWERDNKKITLLADRKNGPASAVGIPGRGTTGYASWTELLKCPNCKTEYDPQKKKKKW